jgi:glutamyl-tRNA reductase
MDGLTHVFELKSVAFRLVENFLKSHEIQELLKSNRKFDLVISETAFNDAILGERMINNNISKTYSIINFCRFL